MRILKIFLLLIFLLLILPLFGLAEEYLIRVKLSNARLDLLRDGRDLIASFPVGVPKFIPKHLPIEGKVMTIEKNPYWYPTNATREQYLLKHKEELPSVIKPGDHRNAMGIAKIMIEFKGQNVNQLIRIHGTNEDSSIGHRISRGCIRMFNKDILNLIEIINGKQTQALFEK